MRPERGEEKKTNLLLLCQSLRICSSGMLQQEGKELNIFVLYRYALVRKYGSTWMFSTCLPINALMGTRLLQHCWICSALFNNAMRVYVMAIRRYKMELFCGINIVFEEIVVESLRQLLSLIVRWFCCIKSLIWDWTNIYFFIIQILLFPAT